jgi:hypothetical protein
MHFRIAIALATLPLVARSQSRPDFSGDWARTDSTSEQRSVASVGDAGFRTGSMGSGWGSPLTLRQQSDRLVVEYAFFSTYDLQPRLRFTFALDGSESRNAVMIGHSESVLRSRAVWRDSTLVITTVYRVPGGAGETTEVRQALTLESPASLVIETTRTGVAGTAPVVTRTIYARR